MTNYTENQSENKTFSKGTEQHQESKSVEPTLGGSPVRDDARLGQELINAFVLKIGAEKTAPIVIDSELKHIAKKAGLTLGSVRKTFAQQTATVEPPEQIENPEFGHLIKEDDPFTPEEQQAAEALLMELNLFSVFADDFILTGYKASRELTDGGLQLLGRTQRATSSGEYGYGNLASGKSDFYNNVTAFFPLVRTLSLTTFSEKFLFYVGGADGNALKGKLLVCGESDLAGQKGEDTFKQKYVRQLLTENRITQGTVEQENKKNQARGMALNGPLTLVMTGTDSPSRLDQQTVSRLYCRHFKHSHASINLVLKAKAAKAANPEPADTTKLLAAQRKWRCFFTLLQKCEPGSPDAIQAIKIPFAAQLVFKKKRHAAMDMRAFDRLLESIEVSALLHQKNRALEDGILTATLEDYYNINASFLASVPSTKGISNDLLDKFLELLAWWQKQQGELGESKTKREIFGALNVDDSTGKHWLYQWVKFELLRDTTIASGRTAIRRYEPINNAELIVKQIKEDESLGVERLELYTSSEKACPSENESHISGARDTLVQGATEKVQACPSDGQARNTALADSLSNACTCSDISSDNPSQKDNSAPYLGAKNACPTHTGEPIPSDFDDDAFEPLDDEDSTALGNNFTLDDLF